MTYKKFRATVRPFLNPHPRIYFGWYFLLVPIHLHFHLPDPLYYALWWAPLSGVTASLLCSLFILVLLFSIWILAEMHFERSAEMLLRLYCYLQEIDPENFREKEGS